MPSINFIQDLAVVVLVAGVVGWICQRLHLSVVVGYLVAGMVVGPYTPPFSLVHDSGRIATLAQVGLIFLIFSIGLRLSLRKLRRLGLALLIATLIGAVIVFNLSRLVGTMLGFSLTESFFLASMLMVSSSAVISKVLAEAGVTHEKVGQLATGITVLEDVVAVVMLTLLSSFVQVGRPGAARFYPLVVGVSLLTTLVAPWLMRHADGISTWLVRRQPGLLRDWVGYYHELLEHLQRRAGRNRLWQLSRKRLVQIGVEILLVTGILVFSEELWRAVEAHLGRGWLFPHDLEVVFWSALMLVVLAPLVAIWRNISALALLYAQISTAGNQRAARLRPVVETGLKTVAGAGLFLWLSAVLPVSGVARWLLVALGLLALAGLAIFWRKLIYWHSELEVGLSGVLRSAGAQSGDATAPWLRPPSDWQLNVSECVLPDLADCRGRKLTELSLRTRFGCSVVGIDRQGFMLMNPSPETVLYPRDRVLLLGSGPQDDRGEEVPGHRVGSRARHGRF